MSEPVDALFSLDRLRRSWSEEPPDEKPEGSPPPPPLHAYARLRQLARARFSSAAAAPLGCFLDELGETLEARFAAGGAVADAAKLDARVLELLDLIEDFTDALEIEAGRARRRDP